MTSSHKTQSAGSVSPVVYRYSIGNRLQDPCTYMYTPFEETEFLHAYLDSRMDFIGNILGDEFTVDGNPLSHLKPLLTSLMASPSYAAPIIPEHSDGIVTMAVLHDILPGLLEHRNPDSVDAGLSSLVSRYEVTKKLYEYYDKRFRKGSGSFEVLPLYVLTHCGCTLFHKTTGRLKFLNTALKMGDMIISVYERLHTDPLLARAAAMSVWLEYRSILSLIEEQHVPI